MDATKQPKCGKATAWMFTINNPTPADDPNLWEGVSYAKWQLEKGELGTLHYQGYVEFDKQKRLSGAKKINGRAAWYMRGGSQQQAIDYVSKAETYEGPGGEIGEKAPGQGARSDLQLMCEMVKDGSTMKEVALSNMAQYVVHNRGLETLGQVIGSTYTHDDVRGIWYWGAPGTGKSHQARQDYPDAYLKSQSKWFCGYAGETAILLDDLDKLGGDKLGHYLKIWADKYACSAEVKGAKVNLKHKAIVITSNYHPDTLWPEDPEMLQAIKRRFKITEFKTLYKTDQSKKRKRSDDATPPPAKRMAIEMPTPTLTKRIHPKCKHGKCADDMPCFCAQNNYIDGKQQSFTMDAMYA
jgi:hypothetical protein